jgi:hypothetical protein
MTEVSGPPQKKVNTCNKGMTSGLKHMLIGAQKMCITTSYNNLILLIQFHQKGTDAFVAQ